MTIYTKLEDNLTKLKLTAIKEYLPSYLEGNDLSLPEILEQLTSKELAYRTQRSTKMSIHVAHFPYAKGLDEFDFDFQPSVDKQRIMNLASMNFISSAKNILFIGSSGVGKTHLATGLGMEACKNHLSTYFVNCHELIERLKLAHQENRLAAILKNYSRYKLLTIITTNIPLSEWGETFSNPTIANAILDRLVHHSEIFKITGKSYRMKDYQEHTKTQK